MDSVKSTATIGFEAKLWLTADKLRNKMDAAEYKHVVLGLILLKYISDTFTDHQAKLVAGEGDYAGANPEDPDEYKAENVFWVPADARWSHLQANAKQSNIGKIVDDAMVALERDNLRLKGVLPKDYARPGLDKQRLGELIDVIATIELTAASEGEKTHRSVDLLGCVYEYSLTRFASAEGKNGGQFYTPSCVVRCLVEMLAPYKGRIYDPACGSGDFGPQQADTFRRDLHPDLRTDCALANPPKTIARLYAPLWLLPSSERQRGLAAGTDFHSHAH